MITPQQIRAARALLGLKQHELAKKAGLSTGTLNNIERGVQTDPKLSTMRAIQEALEAEGVEFSNSEKGAGVHVRETQHAKASNNTILIIDDNELDRELYKLWLSNKSYKIFEAENAKQGYESFTNHNPGCIILDFMMYGKNGFQLLVQMKNDLKKIPPIIFVTATGNAQLKKETLDLGVHAYFSKSDLTKEQLREAVASALS